MHNRNAGIAFVVLGAVLVVSALLFLFGNQREEKIAQVESERILQQLYKALPDPAERRRPSKMAQDTNGETEPTASTTEMTVVEIEGYGCIGYIELPKLERTLPVLSEWDYDRLKIAPCRQFGSSKTDDLVIAAHNYVSHFGPLSRLEPGDQVIFTDMEGEVIPYAVAETKEIEPTEVEAVQNSGYDLVLYTCTYSGAARTAVFCRRISDGKGVHPVEGMSQYAFLFSTEFHDNFADILLFCTMCATLKVII